MDSFFQSVFLGVIQGLSEFLPISSSGHLAVIPWIFDFSDPGLAFDVALHVGTLFAVLLYFWRDWLNIFSLRRDIPEYSNQPRFFLFIVIATLPGLVAGFLFEKQAETIFRHPLLIASTLLIFGAILFFADFFGKKNRSFQEMTVKDAVLIGFSQALAIVPGVSRSGVTITMSLARGMDRVSAARFSFLLSTPIIFGAMVFHVKDFLTIGMNPVFWVGIFSSAISGYIAIFALIRFVERVSYSVFFWYRACVFVLITLIFIARL